MGHYLSNVRDLEFNLFEVLGVGEILSGGGYGDLDEDAARSILDEVRRLAEGPYAESFADADRNPPVFDAERHEVTLPASLKKSLRTAFVGGWDRLSLRPEVGGTPAPKALYWAMVEMFLGSNPSAHVYWAGPTFANILYGLGTEEQQRWAVIAAERHWGATMVLTEPDAGSDVGAARTKAVRQDDGSWHIEGVKRFITSGDSGDLYENIFHLVLARPEGASSGTKGLSLFFVPKYHFDTQTGEIGDRNGVFVTNLEHKMGLKGSATCELTFGAHGVPAVGWLVGEVHKGIAQMFDVIEYARMLVGTKAIATLSTGYLNALEYAKTRVQGSDLTQMADKTAPKVTIINHPDVRRSLTMQKAYAEGLRGLYLYTAAHQDPDVAVHVSGADADLAHRVNDLLLPIVKGVGSERAYRYLAESLQTLGGSGYLQDYPIEQYIRDAKIDSLYEGTTAIQAQDFFFRKVVRDRGVALAHIAEQIQKSIDTESHTETLKAERAQLQKALEDVQAMVADLTSYLLGAEQQATELYKIGLVSVPFLLAVGDLLIGWRLLENAQAAQRAMNGASPADQPFYQGKIAVASFFLTTVLPEVSALRGVVNTIDHSVMSVPEAAY
ncbi:butyryl-CoA dehydrogenase [Mycolicibacterium conceptionense]|uniref:Broad-specificity linear acyl-CoA dehydrogenase FadE5 n=1 Tax=Mycolicibacterium conceptionense TaxID=451644 RepID=A0A1A2V4Y2_9MYCO|nr:MULTISPECIES: acyl-CoA dehydrogenase [Mycolicibacterium]MCW1820665.1 acyl-CoA dehydrogenase [Mycolicibacterium senegalense]OBB15620.1 butyryl-CoA dehydrogenase [Mycolicibacterium conceptionense]OBF02585.1 butyryl-CoA dehydrogenase [Mycolicibacterium conceptionense]OBF17940.1 butyryl-CoA dehydrogenase [Mycolicibacterium conceptionense]OBF40898.1 butyryl-CoA dehydrogenase [Mycolicibacterium conceptionense]